MEAGRIILAGISFAVAGLGAVWDVVIVRPGPCAAQQTYLLANNSAAIIRVEADAVSDTDGVIVYREQAEGWASRRGKARARGGFAQGAYYSAFDIAFA